jgi:hypothetical protein
MCNHKKTTFFSRHYLHNRPASDIGMLIVLLLPFIVLSNHMLVSVCLLGSSVHVHAKPEKVKPSGDTFGI